MYRVTIEKETPQGFLRAEAECPDWLEGIGACLRSHQEQGTSGLEEHALSLALGDCLRSLLLAAPEESNSEAVNGEWRVKIERLDDLEYAVAQAQGEARAERKERGGHW